MINNNKLAWELSQTLNDMDSLQLYIGFTERLPEELLRNTLNKVMSIPDDKIKKTRGALFTFLIKQHESQLEGSSGN